MPIAVDWEEVIMMTGWKGAPWPVPAIKYLPFGQKLLGYTTLGI